ncbi:hypothetical protein FB451DRAFT_1396956 [Mycena latifolia]|nr:hypothetical protein FB451DRAFT_1396956 [Mycena latifolia]
MLSWYRWLHPSSLRVRDSKSTLYDLAATESQIDLAFPRSFRLAGLAGSYPGEYKTLAYFHCGVIHRPFHTMLFTTIAVLAFLSSVSADEPPFLSASNVGRVINTGGTPPTVKKGESATFNWLLTDTTPTAIGVGTTLANVDSKSGNIYIDAVHTFENAPNTFKVIDKGIAKTMFVKDPPKEGDNIMDNTVWTFHVSLQEVEALVKFMTICLPPYMNLRLCLRADPDSGKPSLSLFDATDSAHVDLLLEEEDAVKSAADPQNGPDSTPPTTENADNVAPARRRQHGPRREFFPTSDD